MHCRTSCDFSLLKYVKSSSTNIPSLFADSIFCQNTCQNKQPYMSNNVQNIYSISLGARMPVNEHVDHLNSDAQFGSLKVVPTLLVLFIPYQFQNGRLCLTAVSKHLRCVNSFSGLAVLRISIPFLACRLLILLVLPVFWN